MILKKIMLAVMLAILIATPLLPMKASAISNYNNLIDDAIFNNANSMSAPQIDAFLNTFPSSCISTNNGFTAPLPTGYSSSTKFTYGAANVSAGTVIATVAQAFNINPQVILTTLQKEQGLVRGDGGNVVRNGTDCGALAISASMGYNCPDSMHLTSYGGFRLYAHNGVNVTSVNNTCVEHAAYVGFSQQITIAAWQFTFDQHRSEGLNNWYASAPGWDNSDDLNTCYSNRMVQGGPYKLCPDRFNTPGNNYSGLYSIDGSTVHMDNGATAALYNFTPHLHGQQLFVDTFVTWFGSPYIGCGTNEPTQAQVSSYYNPRTYDHFYTAYQCEANVLTAQLGYRSDGPEYNTTNPNTVPGAQIVWRLYNPSTGQHLWTVSQEDINSATQQSGFRVEGIAFYVAPPSAPGVHIVWRLYNPATFQHVWTPSQNSINLLTNQLGFRVEGIAFYSQ